MSEEARAKPKAVPPRDSASLIIVDHSGKTPKVLMGKRHAGHKFMPGKFVFPGGRIEDEDVPPGTAPDPMPAARRAAVRETAEEVGLDSVWAVEHVLTPKVVRSPYPYTADGKLNDTRAVQIGSVNASMFALVADGKNGLRVLQMISPENVPTHMGFSPVPNPKLIATYPTHGPAVAVSRGLDRDRVVDETGNQTVVFGRRGSRPFNRQEAERLFLHNGQTYSVTDAPPGPARR